MIDDERVPASLLLAALSVTLALTLLSALFPNVGYPIASVGLAFGTASAVVWAPRPVLIPRTRLCVCVLFALTFAFLDVIVNTDWYLSYLQLLILSYVIFYPLMLWTLIFGAKRAYADAEFVLWLIFFTSVVVADVKPTATAPADPTATNSGVALLSAYLYGRTHLAVESLSRRPHRARRRIWRARYLIGVLGAAHVALFAVAVAYADWFAVAVPVASAACLAAALAHRAGALPAALFT